MQKFSYRLIIFDLAGTLIQMNDDSFIPKLVDGAVEVLKKLKKRGYLLALATSESRRNVLSIFSENNLMQIFDASRCGGETFSKPHPQMLEEILTELVIEPEHAVMIGDSVYDMQMAQNANVASIAVTYGADSKEKLNIFHPLAVIDDIQELLKMFV